jgi:hypothetical protein
VGKLGFKQRVSWVYIGIVGRINSNYDVLQCATHLLPLGKYPIYILKRPRANVSQVGNCEEGSGTTECTVSVRPGLRRVNPVVRGYI